MAAPATNGNPTASSAEDGTQQPPIKIFTGADSFGCSLKEALVAHLGSLPNVEVVDLGVDKYYTIASAVGRRVSTSPAGTARGLLACGTGVGVSIFANKHPGIYAATCTTVGDAVNTRSINNCNVLSVSGMSTPASTAVEILDAWLKTPFRSPCPASGDSPWPDEIQQFFGNSISEMKQIPFESSSCAICCIRKNLKFDPVNIMPGAEMKIVRESPTSAMVRFKAGSVEPAHHHTFGHDVVVMKGRKKVWNLDRKESFELEEGDYLYTPAGDVHRVKYFVDTEFFIRWDGDWDIFLDEDLDVATAEIDKALATSSE